MSQRNGSARLHFQSRPPDQGDRPAHRFSAPDLLERSDGLERAHQMARGAGTPPPMWSQLPRSEGRRVHGASRLSNGEQDVAESGLM